MQVMERVMAPEVFAMKKQKLESKMKLFQKATFIALNVKRQVGARVKSGISPATPNRCTAQVAGHHCNPSQDRESPTTP